MIPRRIIALAAACVGLAACDGPGGDAPGAVSQGEAEALDDAASMLEERRLPDGVAPDIDAPPIMKDETGPAEVPGAAIDEQ